MADSGADPLSWGIALECERRLLIFYSISSSSCAAATDKQSWGTIVRARRSMDRKDRDSALSLEETSPASRGARPSVSARSGDDSEMNVGRHKNARPRRAPRSGDVMATAADDEAAR